MDNDNPVRPIEQQKPSDLAQQYYGRDLKDIRLLNETPRVEYNSDHIGVLIRPTRNVWEMGDEERKVFLDDFARAGVVAFETSQAVNSAVERVAEVTDPLEDNNDFGKNPLAQVGINGSPPEALTRLSTRLSRDLQRAMWESEPRSLLSGSRSGVEKNPVGYASFDYGDHTAAGEEEKLGKIWWKNSIEMVILRDGSIVVNGGDKRSHAIANYFRNLPPYFQDRIGSVAGVREHGTGNFDYTLYSPYPSDETYGIVDLNDINSVLSRISEQFGFVNDPLVTKTEMLPKDLEGKNNPLPRTELVGGRLVTPDGKIALSAEVYESGFHHKDNTGETPPILYDIKFPDEAALAEGRVYNRTFVDIGDGKYLYVPQVSKARQKEGFQVTHLPLKVQFRAEYTGGNVYQMRKPARDCTPEMWDQQNVALFRGVSQLLQEHYKAA